MVRLEPKVEGKSRHLQAPSQLPFQFATMAETKNFQQTYGTYQTFGEITAAQLGGIFLETSDGLKTHHFGERPWRFAHSCHVEDSSFIGHGLTLAEHMSELRVVAESRAVSFRCQCKMKVLASRHVCTTPLPPPPSPPQSINSVWLSAAPTLNTCLRAAAYSVDSAIMGVFTSPTCVKLLAADSRLQRQS